MTRLLAALSIALTVLYVPAASAAQLVYVEWKDCGYCKVFNRQMIWAYGSSAVGRKVPLRRVNILGRWPADLKRVSRPSYTPVFILVENGREIGRFAGYTSPQGFTSSLQGLLKRRH
ncbi:transcriptional regulator [Taklimakanibacter lacteus]|uniref:transcriptional regulator n=1 Tax=Taklimakanibacter lacteus TaxID=2268456 RepID=UPI000E66B8CA